MKLRRIFVFLLIILIAVSLKLPDVVQMLGFDFNALPIVLPVNIMAADAEVKSVEEFEKVVLSAISEVTDSIKVRIVRYDEETYDVNRIFKKVMEENVGLGFVSGCSASITKTFGKEAVIVELKLQYLYPAEKVIAMRAATDKRANDIIGNIIKSGMSDYEKILAVHDNIIKNSIYDSANADNDTVPPEGHEAYGVLIAGTGVCDSYAKAVKLLLEKTGVQCMLVEGSKTEIAGQEPGNIDHAWNIVRIDGEYYHVDTTWDDVSEDKDSGEILYHYLNLNDEGMQKTHIWDRSRYPACTGTKYNFFVYNKLFVNNHTEALSVLVKAISGRKEKLMIRISDYTKATYNIQGMIQKAAEKSKLRQRISAKWIINDSLGILDIEFKY